MYDSMLCFLDCFVTSSLAMTSVPKLHKKVYMQQPSKVWEMQVYCIRLIY